MAFKRLSAICVRLSSVESRVGLPLKWSFIGSEGLCLVEVKELAAREVEEGLVSDKEGLMTELEGLMAELEGLLAELEGLMAELEGLMVELDGLMAELEVLMGGGLEIV